MLEYPVLIHTLYIRHTVDIHSDAVVIFMVLHTMDVFCSIRMCGCGVFCRRPPVYAACWQTMSTPWCQHTNCINRRHRVLPPYFPRRYFCSAAKQFYYSHLAVSTVAKNTELQAGFRVSSECECDSKFGWCLFPMHLCRELRADQRYMPSMHFYTVFSCLQRPLLHVSAAHQSR